MRVKIEEEFFVTQHFSAPSGTVKGLEFFKFFLGEI